jgi:hypothetical protein
MEDTDYFDLIQDRNGERKLFESCRINGFELRIIRDEAIKLKLDICGECPSVTYPYTDKSRCQSSFRAQVSDMSGTVIRMERFNGDSVKYLINGKEYKNIYGMTLSVKKEGGTKTELWIKRVMEVGPDIPEIIDELTINAQLLRDKYEYRHFGTFKIFIKRLVLIADETNINSADTVVGPLRYYVAGTVTADVFSSTEGSIV